MSTRENFIAKYGKDKFYIFRKTAKEQLVPKQADIYRACDLARSTVCYYFTGVMGVSFEEFQSEKFSKLEKKLRKLYVEKGLSAAAIGVKLGRTHDFVRKYLVQFGLDEEARVCKRKKELEQVKIIKKLVHTHSLASIERKLGRGGVSYLCEK